MTSVAPPRASLAVTEYRTLTRIAGPLLFVQRVGEVGLGELVAIATPDGEVRYGQVLEVDHSLAVAQVFSGTAGLDLTRTRVRFLGEPARLDVGLSMLGRTFDGAGRPIDGGPPVLPEDTLDIHGLPINPAARAHPSECILTGISAIDGLNVLTRGQKLPVFSGAGLPAHELAAQIASQASLFRRAGAGEEFAVVFAAVGITHREVAFFQDHFRLSGAMERTVLFLNRADDPTIERLFTPRAALTAAEHLAFTHGRHVLVILTDMTHYCEALREVAAAREEVPGRRGYPGYLYSDLASLYERAGRVRGRPGSITQLAILTMPDDDITHPVPDLTGYITEGQIVLSRELHQKGVYPPIDVLPSLSRLMNAGVGEGRTRADHRVVADQLYSLYAQAGDLRRLAAILGETALSPDDQRLLAFGDRFEHEFIGQGLSHRPLETTFDLAWQMLGDMPRELLKRIPEAVLRKELGDRQTPAGEAR